MNLILAAHPAQVHPWVLPTVALWLLTWAVVGGAVWLSRRARRPRPTVPAVQSRPPAQVHEITDAPERPAFDSAYTIGTSDDGEGGEST